MGLRERLQGIELGAKNGGITLTLADIEAALLSDGGAEPDFMAACSCGIYSPRAPRSNWAVQSWLALHRGDGHIVEEIKA